ncbi:MAG: ATP-binding protein [Sporomusaceae bacterium]|nr:ATP-binding protein [Sporomusaceae bacterium]
MRELSLHILDLVQNSLEAGAGEISLTIQEDPSNDLFFLSVSDDGRGMSRQELECVRNPFVTSRYTRKIGLGLSLIEMSTSRAGGALEIESKPGAGTTVTAIYQYYHLDRPPLGKIKDTILNILVANPSLRFYYQHRVKERSFSLSSQEIYEILGGISLTQPDVLQWLTRYLEEQYERLYGGVGHEDA